MKNKKGQFLMFGIFAIIAAIVLVLIFVSSKFRFMLIGGLLFFVMVSILLKGDLNKTKGIACVVLFAGSMFFLFGAGLLQTSLVQQASYPSSYNYVYKADFGHACCVRNTDWDSIYGPRYTDDVTVFQCNYAAPDCEIDLIPHCRAIDNIVPVWNLCNLDGTNCAALQSHSFGNSLFGCSNADVYTFTIPYGKEVKINTVGTISGGYVQAEVKAKTYYVQGEENGKIFNPQSTGCTLNPNAKGAILSDGLNQLTYFPPNNCVNYFLDFIATATQTYNYNGQQVVCQARILYSINNQTMKDGSTIMVQGDTIKGVDCCPSESNCGLDFHPKANLIRECTYTSQCSNGGQPVAVDSTHYVTFTCQTSGCPAGYSACCLKSANILAECTTNTECITKHGSGWACDLGTTDFGTCKQSQVQPTCGDNVCNSLNNENCNTCPSDCKYQSDGVTLCTPVNNTNDSCNALALAHPLMGYQWITTTKQTVGSFLFGWLGVKPKTEAFCKATFLIYWVAGGIILFTIILIVIIFASKSKHKNNRRYKRR